MNLAQALHSTARRYCQERSQFWWQQAAELRQKASQVHNRVHYQQQLPAFYGRSKVLITICSEVEHLDSDELEDLDDTRRLILRAGREATETKPRANMDKSLIFEYVQTQPRPSTQAAIEQERIAFCTYIQNLANSQLQSAQPLPYRRVLSPAESEAMWSRLRRQWQIIGNRWYPLAKCSLPNIVAFQSDAFEDFCSSVSLSDLLLSFGIRRIWELREYGIEYVQDVSLFEPVYSNYEGYWSSENLDWIVYASHEDSVTVGGWLLENIKAQWRDWEQHIW